ncbi:transcriptional regulator domain-containing protein [Rhodopseudomonas parapalustris]|jgi:hypothetical protein
MTPDASGWRSAARYAHVADMTASDIAWEWLRRNESYDRDFQALNNSKVDPRPLTDNIRQRWGLRFPGEPVGAPSRCAGLLAPGRRYERHRTCGTTRGSFRKR